MVTNSGTSSDREKSRKKMDDADEQRFVLSSNSEATKPSTYSSARKSSSDSEAMRSEQAPSKSRDNLATAQRICKRDESSKYSKLVITETMKYDKAASESTKSSTCSSARNSSEAKRSEQAPFKSRDNLTTAQKTRKRDESPTECKRVITEKMKTEKVSDVEKSHRKKWAWYDRGAKIHQAEKFRNGACANCGSMTHDAKSCFERARKVGAKFTGKHIAADEKIESIELDYAGKRDRWNGCDTSQYCHVQEKKFEERRMARFNYLVKQKQEDKSCDDEDIPQDSAVNHQPAIPKSRWEEDIYVNNHTSVWGSYWENHQWGYKCCLQTDKNSLCIA